MRKCRNKKRNVRGLLIKVVPILFIILCILILFRDRILKSRIFISISDKVDFIVNRKNIKIPEDALAFSVYDISNNKYLFFEGGNQLTTVASLAKLFVIDYAINKVKLDDVLEVNEDLLQLVPEGSSLAHLKCGNYTAKQIMQAMLVPSGNDAAYALAYNIGKYELGDGHTAREYVDYFVKNLDQYLKNEGYSNTDLFDPSGFSTQAYTNLDDINKVSLKLLNHDFVKECIGESSFTIKTDHGDFTWKNTNEFLDKNSLYYNENIKGVKTGTMASSYNLVALYEKDGKRYLITCLASQSNKDRYKAVQTAIDMIIEKKKRPLNRFSFF